MSKTAFLFDNDHFSVGFLQIVLSDLGLVVRAFSDAHEALEMIRKEKPQIIFLDTMVPGAEGLFLCAQIKADPALKDVKVVIISGKIYFDDKARADWSRADLYIHKPIEPEELYAALQKLLPDQRSPTLEALDGDLPSPEASVTQKAVIDLSPATAAEKREESKKRPLLLRFWGEGLHADCISLSDRGRLLVFDAGQGLEALTSNQQPDVTEVWLFISHFHQSHVAGLKYAQRWIDSGITLHVVGPSESELMLEKLVQRVLPAQRVWVHSVGAGRFDLLSDLDIELMYTMHPGPCFAFRVATPARSFVIATDSELPADCPEYIESLARFAFGADVLVHDSRYVEDDYHLHERHGHAHLGAALDLAIRADARCLTLYHVDAKYDTRRRLKMLFWLHSYQEETMKLESCHLAHSGLEIAV